MIETPRYDLTWFKVAFGRLAVKVYTEGEHVLRFEATTHNAKDLRVAACWTGSPTSSQRWPASPSGSAPPWTASGVGFLTDTTLDELPRASQLGAVRVGGIDLNKPRIHTALRARSSPYAPRPAASPMGNGPTRCTP